MNDKQQILYSMKNKHTNETVLVNTSTTGYYRTFLELSDNYNNYVNNYTPGMLHPEDIIFKRYTINVEDITDLAKTLIC